MRDSLTPSPAITLSPRERQVLGHIGIGMTHRQVARALGISQHTVDTYVKRIKGKLGSRNKADLTRAAIQYDVLYEISDPDPSGAIA